MQPATMSCQLYKGAFSGEVVFGVRLISGEVYEGIAPKGYAHHESGDLSSDTPLNGGVRVAVLRNGGKSALVSAPSGETFEVPSTSITYLS